MGCGWLGLGSVVMRSGNFNAEDAMDAVWVGRVGAFYRVVSCSDTIFIFLHRVHRALRVIVLDQEL